MTKRLATALLLVFFSAILSASALEITEIMYDPAQCSDAKCEWVEVYNPGNQTINLTGCFFQGKELLGEVEKGEYFIIARNSEEFITHFLAGNSSTIQVIEKKFSLKNSGQKIVLEGHESCKDSIDYSGHTLFANGNNKTLEKNSQAEWKESISKGGTPGFENIFLNVSSDFSPLKITEILPQPQSGADGIMPFGEWVEIYNSGTKDIDLSGLKLLDNNPKHSLSIADNNVLEGTIICGGCYKVVYVNGYYNFNLKDSGDHIKLALEDGTILDEVVYESSTHGMSYGLVKGTLFTTSPTPGKENYYEEGCDWEIEIESDSSIFTNEDFEFSVFIKRHAGFAHNITVRGFIEDLFGKKVKEYSPWTQKYVAGSPAKVETYSPNLLEGSYMVNFEIADVNCDDQNMHNNVVTRLFAINPVYKQNKSTISIEKLYLGNDDSVEWGDQFTAKAVIYKGDETKKSVQAWVEKNSEKVSKTTKLLVDDPYKEYVLTIPLQLEPNCHNKISDGGALLVVEAFGLRDEKVLNIDGVDKEVCKDYLEYVKEAEKESNKKAKASLKFDFAQVPKTLVAGEAFSISVALQGDGKYDLWAYLYRGAKCYSCDSGKDKKDEEKVKVELRGDKEMIDVVLQPDMGMEEGEYKLKVVLLKEGYKTTKDLTTKIIVQENELHEKEQAVNLLSETPDQVEVVPQSQKVYGTSPVGFVVFQSSSEKAKKLIPTILFISFGLLSVVLAWRS